MPVPDRAAHRIALVSLAGTATVLPGGAAALGAGPGADGEKIDFAPPLISEYDEKVGTPAAIGDIDGDGATHAASQGGLGLRILVGQADGTFVPGQYISLGVSPRSTTLADLDDDDDLDLVFTRRPDVVAAHATATAFVRNVSR